MPLVLQKARRTPRRADGNLLTRAEERIAAVMERGWRSLGDALSGSALTEALRTGNLARLTRGREWDDFAEALTGGLTPELAESVVAGGVDGVAALPASVRARMVFDRIDPRAVGYARAQAANLVTAVTDSERVVLQNIVTSAFTEQRTARETARTIEGALRGGIGLTERGHRAAENARRVELDRLIAGGMSPADADKAAWRHYDRVTDRAIKTRARTIARTEIQRAQNAGRYLSWAQAVETGFASPESRKRWIADGSPPCEECLSVDDEIVLWDDVFSNGIEMPPAHPNCRCNATLLPDDVELTPRDETLDVEPAKIDAGPDLPKKDEGGYKPKPDRTAEITPEFLRDANKAKAALPKDIPVGEEDVATAFDLFDYHDRPLTVSAAEMDDLIASGHTEVWRGVEGAGDLSAADIVEAQHGSRHYAGYGVSGHGTYTTTSIDRASGYAGMGQGRFDPETGLLGSYTEPGIYRDGRSGLTRWGIRPDARVIDRETLNREYREWFNSVSDSIADTIVDRETSLAAREALDGLSEVFGDVSSYAAARGYDAIAVTKTSEETFYVVLNRGAAVFQTEYGVF